MNRLRKASYFKVISLVLIGLFLCQGNALLAQEQGENLDLQFKRAKNDCLAGNFKKALIRLERLAAACENIGIQREDIKRTYGQTLLFRGICHESLGETKKARKYYKQAKKLAYGGFSLTGLKLSQLKEYNSIRNKIVKKTKTQLKPERASEKIIAREKQPGKKKKFPWLLAAAGGAAVVVLAVLLLKKKPKYTLNVSVGEGVEGSPVTGTYTYKKGEMVNYNYTLKSGYTSLVVKLDGQDVAANGTVKMDRDHILTASASKTYTLSVTRGEGVDGTPDSGAFFYKDGETVEYNYSLKPGYTNLTVTIDGLPAPATGSILMTRDHTLTASAAKTYTLKVTKGEGVIGIPDSGTYSYKQGETVIYNYSLKNGYMDLVVMLDGNPVSANGTITMNKDHTLSASASESTSTIAHARK